VSKQFLNCTSAQNRPFYLLY